LTRGAETGLELECDGGAPGRRLFLSTQFSLCS
jgi:hypothetical protein